MQQRGGEVVSSINVTPLVDVCLVLLIIFMIVVPMIPTTVPLPESRTARPRPESERQITLTLHQDGTVYFGPLAIRREQLVGELQRAFNSSPERHIIVRAERTLRYGDVLRVLKDCRDAGFQEVGIATRPRSGDDLTATRAVPPSAA